MTAKKKKPDETPVAEPVPASKLKAVVAKGPTVKKAESAPLPEPVTKNKPKAAPAAEPVPPTTEALPKRGIFKQPLSKPEPWRFGGRGPRASTDGDGKPQKDAERRGGKSRKVH